MALKKKKKKKKATQKEEESSDSEEEEKPEIKVESKTSSRQAKILDFDPLVQKYLNLISMDEDPTFIFLGLGSGSVEQKKAQIRP